MRDKRLNEERKRNNIFTRISKLQYLEKNLENQPSEVVNPSFLNFIDNLNLHNSLEGFVQKVPNRPHRV